MNLPEIDLESVIICLEQKKIFVTDILDVTKQIEVQSRQEDMEIDKLIEQRQIRIQRIKKCDELIKEKLKLLDNTQKENWERIIKGEEYYPKNGDEKKAFELAFEIKQLFIRTAKIDRRAKENLQKQFDEAKENLTDLRKNKASNSNMFNV